MAIVTLNCLYILILFINIPAFYVIHCMNHNSAINTMDCNYSLLCRLPCWPYLAVVFATLLPKSTELNTHGFEQ
jgi:hypothetical protein